MHDGQMLFDSTLTWNKQEWGVDETLSQLMREKKIKDCIVVGIWNGGRSRHAEYFPQKPFESLSKTQQEIDYLEERDGELYAYEFKWSKQKVKFPKSFLENYQVKVSEVITKENFDLFIGVE